MRDTAERVSGEYRSEPVAGSGCVVQDLRDSLGHASNDA
ncbi:hypothetical protein ThimaDRAFT_3458 [Thiocapsa marina 5811]|uniref:Uncharacterized protein n=1 Tax=Thiocapsa marina 5811 TaxID=768671 RepID=F9UEV5_9GAMM|nr:hypothetical protein ThimaDRAFT_3458 [Thiocapsa marina 5811]